MIRINGKEYEGKNLEVKNGKVWVDGKLASPEEAGVPVYIEVNGDLNSLKVDDCEKLLVKGNVEMLSTMSGNVDIQGDVKGDVKTMSGDVKCSQVMGSVKTMSGDIITR